MFALRTTLPDFYSIAVVLFKYIAFVPAESRGYMKIIHYTKHARKAG